MGRKPPLVEVRWFDAINLSDNDLTIPEAIEKAQIVERHTCGYLIYQDAKRIVVAADYDPSHDGHEAEVGNLTAIPALWGAEVTRRKK